MSKEQCPCVESHFKGNIHAECYKNEEHNCHERECECDCHYAPEEPVSPVETIEESKGCKHTEILTASRNAVVALRARVQRKLLVLQNPFTSGSVIGEFSKQENAYDSLLMDIEEEGCNSCVYDALEPNRKSNFLQFVTEFVEHYGK